MPWCGFSKAPQLGRRGATSLEFALVGSLVLALVFGASEAARYMITLQALRSAADEAARMVMLRGGANLNTGSPPCTGLSGALTGAATAAPFLTASSLTVTMSGCATSVDGVTAVSVTLSYPFTFQVSTFGNRARTMSETARALFY